MTFAVGTMNPVKIQAVKNVISQIWPDAKVMGISAPSGVSEQPMTDDEAIRGARQRATLARNQEGADFGIGIEGSTVDTSDGMLITGWVVILNKNNDEGLGSGGGFILPPAMAEELRRGHELGPVADTFFKMDNLKQKEGVVGVMTNGLVSRTAGTERAVAYALARFLHPEFYSTPSAD